MTSKHTIYFQSSEHLSRIEDQSIDLVVTSPPYPMIEMWDELFSQWDSAAAQALKANDGNQAFEIMHACLDRVWSECTRVVKPGGFVCINIGDATRTIGERFKLYSNHSRITAFFTEKGFDALPVILWRKQTNAPNKFMGSGMLPSGAYVTLEHEYILIFRHGQKRSFSPSERLHRRESAFFWEERNIWFSDLWNLIGVSQVLKSQRTRERSAAYPLEIAHRLVNMYSMKGDIVLDPFLGTGTTAQACMLNNRNSVGYELDPALEEVIFKNLGSFSSRTNALVEQRYQDHCDFIAKYRKEKGEPKHQNLPHGFSVVTGQERDLQLDGLKASRREGDAIICEYEKFIMKTRPTQLDLI
jgi:DNA modification methylase